MPLIDRTYFKAPILLQVTGEFEAIVDEAIATYEPRYLRGVLGNALYDAFSEGLGSDEHSYFSDRFSDDFVLSQYDDRWDWILNGHSFTYNGATYYWPGLLNDGKQSPAANYVYWHYRKDSHSTTTGIGEARSKAENSDIISPASKMVSAWNQMVEWNRTLYYLLSYLTDDNDDLIYPEFEGHTTLQWHLFTTVNEFGI